MTDKWMLLLVSQEDITRQRRTLRSALPSSPSLLPACLSSACQHVLLAEFECCLGSAGGERRGMRDVIQFKNHSLSAWAEISFFIRENTSPRFFVGHLARALIHVVAGGGRESPSTFQRRNMDPRPDRWQRLPLRFNRHVVQTISRITPRVHFARVKNVENRAFGRVCSLVNKPGRRA